MFLELASVESTRSCVRWEGGIVFFSFLRRKDTLHEKLSLYSRCRMRFATLSFFHEFTESMRLQISEYEHAH